MNLKHTYYSNVKDGKLQKNISGLIAADLKRFEGKRVSITLEKLRSIRSTQQNRLYWLYVTILSKETGYRKEEMAEIIKYKFLKREKVIEATGEILPYLESTTKLSKSEFADMVSELQQWASETFGCVLPSPNEQVEFNLT